MKIRTMRQMWRRGTKKEREKGRDKSSYVKIRRTRQRRRRGTRKERENGRDKSN